MEIQHPDSIERTTQLAKSKTSGNPKWFVSKIPCYLKAMNYKVNIEILVTILIDNRILDVLLASE